MKKNTAPKVIPLEPGEDDIRECAYRIYLQSGCIPGHDLENWLNAKSQLEAKLARHAARRARSQRPRREEHRISSENPALAS